MFGISVPACVSTVAPGAFHPLLSVDPLLLSSNSNRSLTKKASAFGVGQGVGMQVAETRTVDAPSDGAEA